MYSDLIGAAKDKYNMEMLFTDFLCYRQPAMEQYQDVPDGEEGGHLWLGGQAKAAEAHGVEVQWCMVRSRKRAVKFFGWVFFLISSGSPHVRPMGRTCGEPDEIELTAAGV